MQFLSTAALVAAAAALVSAEQVYLVVKSDDDSVNGNTLGFPHEGAGINYVFMGTSDQSSPLDFDSSAGTLSQPFIANMNQYLSLDDNAFVALTPAQPTQKFSFSSEGVLEMDGSSEGFYACKNTGDPYNMSANSYELMFYKSDAPSGCISVTLGTSGAAASTGSSGAVSGSGAASSAPSASVVPTAPSSTFVTSTLSSVASADEESTVAKPSVTSSAAASGSASASGAASASVTPVSTAKNGADVVNAPAAAVGAAMLGFVAALI